uniref:AVRa10 n=1 Tax=Blumeria hordei TaxID=2867405 RepID=Q09QS3_BLUHO|nr:AVRa10 [Blumeria hordei]ACJ71250.1 Avra10 [synthetic construct]
MDSSHSKPREKHANKKRTRVQSSKYEHHRGCAPSEGERCPRGRYGGRRSREAKNPRRFNFGILQPRRCRASLGSHRIPQKTVVAPEKRAAVPALPRPVEVRPTKEADIPTAKAAGAENSSLDQPPTAPEAAGREKIFPPELLAAIEAEERRARQKAAQFTICSTAISSVEAALQPLSTGEDKNFVDSIKVYLRAAIAQFVAAGPSTAPPVLPQRPSVGTPATVIPVAIPRNISKATAPLPLRSTWATVTRAGHQKSGAQAPANITSVSAAPSARKQEKKPAASTTA